MRSGSWALLVLIAGSVLVAAEAQQFPRLREQNLNGQEVVLPDVTSGKIAVYVLGFTRSSQGPCSDWAKRVLEDFGKNPGVALYQLPVLEAAPRMLRGMIVSGIRKGVPENLRAEFVPVMHQEAALKGLVGWSESAKDDAYVVLLDRTGVVLYQVHGAASNPGYAALRARVQGLIR